MALQLPLFIFPSYGIVWEHYFKLSPYFYIMARNLRQLYGDGGFKGTCVCSSHLHILKEALKRKVRLTSLERDCPLA